MQDFDDWEFVLSGNILVDVLQGLVESFAGY